MLRRLTLRDVVIVAELDIDLGAGFTVLTGETGAGKSILVDALQLALGNRADAALVREGAPRAEVAAEFDCPPSLARWLDDAGFAASAAAVDNATLLLRRTVDAQGRSRAWINGSPATVAQLREAADALVDIHGQHAWQSLTRPAAVRNLLDTHAGIDTAVLAQRWAAWRAAQTALDAARSQQGTLERERERLAWQIGEVNKLAPGSDEWAALNAEHQRLAHGQALLDAVSAALDALSEADTSAQALLARGIGALEDVVRHDADLAAVVETLRSAQSQIDDAAHTLASDLRRREPDPGRLAELDERLAAWMSLARRYRRAAPELPLLLSTWKEELRSLDAAADLDALQRASAAAEISWRDEAMRVSRLRNAAAPVLAAAVTQSMQQLGMAGGRFEVALLAQPEPQAFGLEGVELRVAGHAGNTPRALAKVASGGELSRLALAIATSTASAVSAVAPARPAAPPAATGATQGEGAAPPDAPAVDPGSSAPTLIFDEIDAGTGGSVADSVGRLMKQLGQRAQVLAVTHLAQVAACADHHFVVAKALLGGATLSTVVPVAGEARVAEVARMLGGETRRDGLSSTSRAHAVAMLDGGAR